MDYLNNYAAAIGVLLGVATFLVNFHFQIKNHRVLKQSIRKEEEGKHG